MLNGQIVPCHLFVNPGLRSGEVPVRDKEVRREVFLMGAGGEDLSVSRSEHRQRSTWGCGGEMRRRTHASPRVRKQRCSVLMQK